jgi:hypothetical protein
MDAEIFIQAINGTLFVVGCLCIVVCFVCLPNLFCRPGAKWKIIAGSLTVVLIYFVMLLIQILVKYG